MAGDDVEQIKQLKYRYLRTLDLKRWDDFTEVFVPAATGDYGTDLAAGPGTSRTRC